MANGHSRVTVVSPDRRVDLSLPGSVPVGDLMAHLLDLCTDHQDRTRALAWMLRPVGGAGLTWASSLDSAGFVTGPFLNSVPDPALPRRASWRTSGTRPRTPSTRP